MAIINRHNPVPHLPIRKDTEEELILFSVLLEAVSKQIEFLPGNFKGRAKQWVSTLQNAGKATLQTLYESIKGNDGHYFLTEHYDFIYMVTRYASETKIGNEQMILGLIKELTQNQEFYEQVYNAMATLGNSGGEWSEEFRNKVVADALSRAIADSRGYPAMDTRPIEITLPLQRKDEIHP